MTKMDDLRWVRVFTPEHIPHYLIEQVKHREFSVDDFFRYHQINCISQEENGFKLNPFSHLYVLADKENQVKGFLWFSVDPLGKDIVIQTFSMDKEYWGNGEAVKKLAQHIKQIRNKAKLNKIFWVTRYPKHSERHGFKRSKDVLMEYVEEEHGKHNDGEHKTQGEHQSPEPRTAKLPEPSIVRSGRSRGSVLPIPSTV